jgi:hypothetical protein
VRWVIGDCVAEDGKVPARIPWHVEGGGGLPVLDLNRFEPSGECRFCGKRLDGIVEEPLQAQG